MHTLGVREGDEGNVYILFCGDISKDTGESWCPDCVKGTNCFMIYATKNYRSIKVGMAGSKTEMAKMRPLANFLWPPTRLIVIHLRGVTRNWYRRVLDTRSLQRPNILYEISKSLDFKNKFLDFMIFLVDF